MEEAQQAPSIAVGAVGAVECPGEGGHGRRWWQWGRWCSVVGCGCGVDLAAEDDAGGLQADGALGLGEDGCLAHVCGGVHRQCPAHGIEDGHHLIQGGTRHIQQVKQQLQLHTWQAGRQAEVCSRQQHWDVVGEAEVLRQADCLVALWW